MARTVGIGIQSFAAEKLCFPFLQAPAYQQKIMLAVDFLDKHADLFSRHGKGICLYIRKAC